MNRGLSLPRNALQLIADVKREDVVAENAGESDAEVSSAEKNA